MCRWMGSHFTTGVTIIGSHFQSEIYLNVVANFRILGVSRDSKWEDSRLKNQKTCCLLNLTISSH